MDSTQLKLQQQNKCINELSNYIDQLQGRIDQLQSTNQQLKKQLQAGHYLSSFVDDKLKNNNELVKMMNEQMLLVDKEKKRWREEIKLKNRELQSQKELIQIQMKNLRNIYQQKLSLLENDWNVKQNELRQDIKILESQNERLTEENMVYKNKLTNIDQCQQMLRIRKQMIELQSNKLKQSRISQDQHFQHKTCQCFDQYESFQTENSNLKNQNEILEFQLRHLKRQMQKDAEIINDLRYKIRDLEKKINRDQNIYSINQKSSQLHSKVLVQLQQLKKERQISVDLLQTTESVRQYNFYRSKQFQKLKRKEEQELSKMNKIFESIDFDLRR